MGTVHHIRRPDVPEQPGAASDVLASRVRNYTRGLLRQLSTFHCLGHLTPLAYKLGLLAIHKMQTNDTVHVEVSIFEVEASAVVGNGMALAGFDGVSISARRWQDAGIQLNRAMRLGMMVSQDVATFDPTPEDDKARSDSIVAMMNEHALGDIVEVFW